MIRTRKPRLDLERAETIAAEGLGFLASDTDRLVRFMTETGIDGASLRSSAGSRHVLTAVLDHLLADESSLLVFTSTAPHSVEDVTAAHQLLNGGNGREWDSR